MLRAEADVEFLDKFFGEFFVNHLWGNHNKLYTITGSQIKYFGYTERFFNLVKFISQALLAYHQFPQLLQLDLFVRKSYYF